MKVLMMGDRINMHWPYTILLLWMLVITYSSVLNCNKMMVALIVYEQSAIEINKVLPLP